MPAVIDKAADLAGLELETMQNSKKSCPVTTALC
jgi:hypothetical protein